MKELPVKSNVNISEVLSRLSGTMYIGLDTTTEVKLPGGKGNVLQGRVFKVTTGMQCSVFQNKFVNGYENQVKKKMVAEGLDPEDFKVGERTWGTRIPETPLIEHEGQYYLEVIVGKSNTDTFYLVNNKVTKHSKTEDGQGCLVDDEGNILTLLPKVYASKEGQGSVEDKVIIRTLKLDSILEIRCNQTAYQDVYYKPE